MKKVIFYGLISDGQQFGFYLMIMHLIAYFKTNANALTYVVGH